ncbi:unnamed protein product [Ixodes persulcatus]
MLSSDHKITTANRTLSHALELLDTRGATTSPSRADSGSWEGDKGRCNGTTIVAVALIGVVIVGATLVVKGVTSQHYASASNTAALPSSQTSTPQHWAHVAAINVSEYAIVGI